MGPPGADGPTGLTGGQGPKGDPGNDVSQHPVIMLAVINVDCGRVCVCVCVCVCARTCVCVICVICVWCRDLTATGDHPDTRV